MSKLSKVLTLSGLLLVMLSSMATAQTVVNVRQMKPFMPQTNYMSLLGYLRWNYFMTNHAWINVEEANRLVKAQLGN